MLHTTSTASVTKESYHFSCQKLTDAITDAVHVQQDITCFHHPTEAVGNLYTAWDRNGDNCIA